MPEISRFYGIVITMYFNDHEPAHFHARYGDDVAEIGIDPLVVLIGSLPRRALNLVLDWAELHQAELKDNWRRRNESGAMDRIAPLR